MNEKEEAATWPDGTPRSRNNVFTNHGYVPGGEAAPSPVRKQYQRMGFGARNGTIPGMGLTDPRPSGLTIKKQRA